MKRQKNFAYVDFANEVDLQDTLKAHSSGVSLEHIARKLANLAVYP